MDAMRNAEMANSQRFFRHDKAEAAEGDHVHNAKAINGLTRMPKRTPEPTPIQISRLLADYARATPIKEDERSNLLTDLIAKFDPFNPYQPVIFSHMLYKTALDWSDRGGIYPLAVGYKTLGQGSFNRAIEVTIIDRSGVDHTYVLRIPLEEYRDRVPYDVAILQHFQTTKVAHMVPKIHFACPYSTHSEFGWPYIVLSRIPGQTMAHAFPKATLEQRKQIADELGRMYKLMFNDRGSSVAGRIRPDPHSPGRVTIEAYTRQMRMQRRTDPVGAQNCIDRLLDAVELDAHRAESQWQVDVHSMCKTMFDDMKAIGVWSRRGYDAIRPFHLDLWPRNIMCDLTATKKNRKPIISSIIDWDSAEYVPSFMLARTPIWLWQENYWTEWLHEKEIPPKEYWADHEWNSYWGYDGLPDTYNELVPEARLRGTCARNGEIMDAFILAVGPEYMEMAGNPLLIWSRQLFRIIKRGRLCHKDIRTVEFWYRGWQRLIRTTRIQERYQFALTDDGRPVRRPRWGRSEVPRIRTWGRGHGQRNSLAGDSRRGWRGSAVCTLVRLSRVSRRPPRRWLRT